MKYGKYEYERNFIVNGDEIKQRTKEVKYFTDTYLNGTQLRLRKVEAKTGTQYKLTQKKKELPAKKGVKKINTIYLSSTEYDVLNKIQGYKIEKTRYIIEINQQRMGIDIIQVGEEQICLAEVEFETEVEMNSFSMPLDYSNEVTDDPTYSGFEIARKYSGNDST